MGRYRRCTEERTIVRLWVCGNLMSFASLGQTSCRIKGWFAYSNVFRARMQQPRCSGIPCHEKRFRKPSFTLLELVKEPSGGEFRTCVEFCMHENGQTTKKARTATCDRRHDFDEHILTSMTIIHHANELERLRQACLRPDAENSSNNGNHPGQLNSQPLIRKPIHCSKSWSAITCMVDHSQT